MPAIVALGGIASARAFGGAVPDFSMLAKQWFLIPVALLMGMLLGGPLEEEFGWRGFATVRLQERHSALYSQHHSGSSVGPLAPSGVPHPLVHPAWPAGDALPTARHCPGDLIHLDLQQHKRKCRDGDAGARVINLTITVLPVTPSAAGSQQPLVFAVGLLYVLTLTVLLLFGPKSLTRAAGTPVIQQTQSPG